MKYFYDKMKFLQKRYEELLAEMYKRGYNPNYTDSSIFTNCPKEFYNDYTPTPETLELNRQRIKERTK